MNWSLRYGFSAIGYFLQRTLAKPAIIAAFYILSIFQFAEENSRFFCFFPYSAHSTQHFFLP